MEVHDVQPITDMQLYRCGGLGLDAFSAMPDRCIS